MDRRRFLSTLLGAAGAAAGWTVGVRPVLGATEPLPGTAPRTTPPPGPAAPEAQPPEAERPNATPNPPRTPRRRAEFARGLPRGTKLAGSVIETVGEVRCGTMPVVLRDPVGNRFQVDVARRDWLGPRGIGHTRQLSLYLSNDGGGSTPTPEAHGLAVLALAHRLGTFERGGARWPTLLTLQERLERHPGGAYKIC